jgi:hypothetical protein
MRHHIRGRHKVLHSSPATNRPLGERISDGLSRLVRGLFWLGLAYVAWVMFARYTQSVKLPNGAVLASRPDLTYTQRIDLFRPGELRPVVRTIDQLCYNDKAVWVSTIDYNYYVWLNLNSVPIKSSSDSYSRVIAQSKLFDERDNCNGYYKSDMDALTLIAGFCPVIPDIEWQKRRFAQAHDYLCDPRPPWMWTSDTAQSPSP